MIKLGKIDWSLLLKNTLGKLNKEGVSEKDCIDFDFIIVRLFLRDVIMNLPCFPMNLRWAYFMRLRQKNIGWLLLISMKKKKIILFPKTKNTTQMKENIRKRLIPESEK